jgi:hypothetical protein
VTFEMVDGDEFLAGSHRKRLTEGGADDDAADQAGSGRRRHRIDVAKPQTRFGERLTGDALDMV